MTALGALVLTLATSFPALQQRELQPETYRSPSGEWSLRVEPVEPFEPKHATYTMTRGGREAWRTLHSFALWVAAVNDDGRVAGVTYSGSVSEPGGFLRVLLLSAEGDIVLDESHERVSSNASHLGPSPWAKRVFFQPDLQRFVVQVGYRDAILLQDICWVYDLRTGAPVLQHRLERERELGGSPRLFGVRALPDTPLTLLHWYLTDYSTDPWARDGVFELVDEDWNVAWRLELLHDYEVGGDDFEEKVLENVLQEKGAILSTGPGRFDLHFVAESQRVGFAAERAGTRWTVRETGRMPFVVESPAEIPVQRLRLLSRITLNEDDPPAAEPLGRPSIARFDRLTGRILIADRKTHAIHVFDTNGRRIMVCRPESETSEEPKSPKQMFCDEEGRLYVGPVYSKHYVRFSNEGTCEGLQSLPERRTVVFPQATFAWDIGSKLDRSLMGTSGDPLRLDKRPDGDWFREIQGVAVADDGSLAVLEGPKYDRSRPPADSVSLFGPHGEARSVHPLPLPAGVRDVLFAGRALLLTDGNMRAHRLDPANGELVRLDIDDAFETKRAFELGLSHDGTELWVLVLWKKEFLRFALGE